MPEQNPLADPSHLPSLKRQHLGVRIWFWLPIANVVLAIALGILAVASPEAREWGQLRANATEPISAPPLTVLLPACFLSLTSLIYIFGGIQFTSSANTPPNNYQAKVPAAIFMLALIIAPIMGCISIYLSYFTITPTHHIQSASSVGSVLLLVFTTIALVDHLGRLAEIYAQPILKNQLVRNLWLLLMLSGITAVLGIAAGTVAADLPQPDPASPTLPPPQVLALGVLAALFGLAALVVQVLLLISLNTLANALKHYITMHNIYTEEQQQNPA